MVPGNTAAGFTNSVSLYGDKNCTLHDFMTLAMQHSMLWVGTGMMPANSKAAPARPHQQPGLVGRPDDRHPPTA